MVYILTFEKILLLFLGLLHDLNRGLCILFLLDYLDKWRLIKCLLLSFVQSFINLFVEAQLTIEHCVHLPRKRYEELVLVEIAEGKALVWVVREHSLHEILQSLVLYEIESRVASLDELVLRGPIRGVQVWVAACGHLKKANPKAVHIRRIRIRFLLHDLRG